MTDLDSIEFDPANTVLTAIDPEQPDRTERIGGRYGLPYLKAFLEDINFRHSDGEERYGRQYQREVIRQKGLAIRSPVSGLRICSNRSLAVQGKVFFYFGERVQYFVISSTINLAYPLSALFLPGKNLLLSWSLIRHPKLLIRHLGDLLQRRSEPVSPVENVTPVILMGHRNFAHHLWNELSAVERLVKEVLAPPFPELWLAREPLGRTEAIFPEIADWRLRRLGDRKSLSANDPQKLFVNLAASHISTELRARLAVHASSACTAHTKALADRIREFSPPAFWLSVRTQNPTFIDQRQTLTAIAAAILTSYPRCAIIFDGFSLPQDWEATDQKMRAFYQDSAQSAKREIETIIGGLRQVCPPGPGQFLVNAGGHSILDSIVLAHLADAYFCHQGTVQHKIAWTANKPGIIHAPSAMLGTNLLERHGSCLDDPAWPTALDPAMVADLSGRKQTNYRAVDQLALAEFVLGYFKRCISPGQAGRP